MREKTFTLKSEVGEIIYPVENGTAKFGKKDRWDLVIAVDYRGYVREFVPIQDSKVLRAIEIIRRDPQLIELWKRKKERIENVRTRGSD